MTMVTMRREGCVDIVGRCRHPGSGETKVCEAIPALRFQADVIVSYLFGGQLRP